MEWKSYIPDLQRYGDFTVNGKQAFCIDHDKKTPPTGTMGTEEIYDNEDLAKCLYYGWLGEKQWEGFTSREMGIVCTTLALDYFNNGKTHKVATDFINFLESVDMPDITLDFSNRKVNAFLTEDKKEQRTETITVTGSSDYFLTLKLQNGVTLVNETKGTTETGTVKLYGGEKFYLKALLTVNGTWTSDKIENCKYRFQPIVYRTEKDTYQDVASEELTPVVDKGTTTNLTVNWLNTGSLTIHKVDADNKNIAISDTVFDIYDLQGNLVATVKTDTHGIAKINNILVGTYKIVEKSTNQAYKVNTNGVEAKVSKGNTDVTITNERKKGTLTIYKLDSDNKKTPISGVKFALYTDSDKLVGTYITNSNGKIEINGLNIGKYYVKEVETDKRYTLNTEKINVEIKMDEATQIKVYNKIIEGQIRIVKIDKDNKKITLPGVEFEILDSKMNIIETLKTDENGEALSSKLPAIDEVYHVREKATHDMYVLSDEVREVVLEENKIVDITFENEKKKGTISIVKADKLNEDIRLEGVVFGIYNDEGELVTTIITDENGEGTSERLVLGTYFIKELDTGSPYYLLDEEIYRTEITENGENMLIELYNERTDIDVTVEKKRKCRS